MPSTYFFLGSAGFYNPCLDSKSEICCSMRRVRPMSSRPLTRASLRAASMSKEMEISSLSSQTRC